MLPCYSYEWWCNNTVRRFPAADYVTHVPFLSFTHTAKQWNFKDVRTNCFCASWLRTYFMSQRHATSCIKRTHWENCPNKYRAGSCCDNFARSLLSQMAGDPQFFLIGSFVLRFSTDCKKMNKKSMWEVYKCLIFLPTRHQILPIFQLPGECKCDHYFLKEHHQLNRFAL